MHVGMPKLLSALPMQVHKGVQEIWNTRTQIEEVDQLVIEVEVQWVGHVILESSTGAEAWVSYSSGLT